ncbi:MULTISPECIES: Lrp/AsnC family transcriptional regulator [unclassified Streptomyces]|uniref:Lrp/AsnC family transcriptional regulator n=2 Tax=Streptomyces TaxID=1883 RepID=UPI0022504E9F|nr:MULTISPECIES: Lrp/AsnC family transcriptional regulator [unclassified Streptomyces]MCX4403223.1 Lrp/AsnC family transcriptional regulator [Streptomyces sp. NBC_01764]MCX5181802.1 Lrp/AsnC family transcriptional regulator [Streptomyces sp. NBC_00268]
MRKKTPCDGADFGFEPPGTRRNAPPGGVQEFATPGLDELDRAVVHALQIRPRASWTLIGDVLGVDPVTAARRWQRLTEAGLAWVTAYPRLSDSRIVVSAIVEVDTEPGASEQVARALAADAAVVNVKLMAGGRDLVAAVQVRDLNELARLNTLLFQGTPGVRTTRTHVSTGVSTEGSRWRLRSLDAAQCARIEAATTLDTPTVGAGETEWDALDARLVELLSTDGRMSLSRLATAADAGVTTVRRRLRSLLLSGVSLRCDLARPLSGWPLSAVYFASVPGRYLEETSRVLAGVREVRSCAITAGPNNLVIDVWLRELADVHSFEAHLSRQLPRLTIGDRSVVLRTVKHMGRLLGEDGHCVGVVPLRLP